MKFKKKILIITSRYPYPVTGGDKLRITEIAKHLSKNYLIDLISIGNTIVPKKKIINKQYIFKNNIFNIFAQIIKTLFNKKPLQIGLYWLPNLKRKIEEIQNNYDIIICHLIRTAKYLPQEFKGIKILEMTDIISKNYSTVLSELNYFNPLRIIYKYEYEKLKEFEYEQIKLFDQTIIVNKNDFKNNAYLNKLKYKIKTIGNGTIIKKNYYLKKNKKKFIVFFGNINSLANFTACVNFINNVLPLVKKNFLNLEFKIIGNISLAKKIYFFIKKIKFESNVKNFSKYVPNSLAGICNVKIQSGLQNKILDYTGSGLPAIINSISNNFKNFGRNDVLVYKSANHFIKYLENLNHIPKFRMKISRNCHKKTKLYYSWDKVLKKYITF